MVSDGFGAFILAPSGRSGEYRAQCQQRAHQFAQCPDALSAPLNPTPTLLEKNSISVCNAGTLMNQMLT